MKEGFAHLLLIEGYDAQSFLSHPHTDVTAQLKTQNEKKTTKRMIEDEEFKVPKKTARESNRTTQDAVVIAVAAITTSNKFQTLITEKEMDIETISDENVDSKKKESQNITIKKQRKERR
ncbi:hypothetical protein WA026_008290, partial [Henosepilachna vigintioctopunctata]